ncbi:MAG: M3 family metallopeptidase [Bacteroidales bacterium]|nr:M3 family metallopeptidase [Bacteroidales bacterium]
MKRNLLIAGACLAIVAATNVSCNKTMEANPLLAESTAPFGAPQFDQIKDEHYLPAFEQAIAEAKADIDAIVANQEEPTFENTIEAMEYAGESFSKVAGIFFNVMEANTNDTLQEIAEKVSPMLTEYSMYVSLNNDLFQRVKAVYEKKDELGLAQDQMTLLENSYKDFVRGGANLSDEDKTLYSKWSEELSLTTLQFSKNVLAATNAYTLNIKDEADLAGLPEFVKVMGAETAAEKGHEGWTFTLDYPSYSPFLKYSTNRELRKQIWMAYNTRAIGGEFDNTEIVKKIVDLRIKIANILGYETYADYALEERMAKNKQTVNNFIMQLLEPSLEFAKKDVADVYAYAKKNGFEDSQLMPWDFTYWSERYQEAEYSLNTEALKPYFQLESCIDAVFGLANTLYGITFQELDNVPVYHEDVKVYEVKDHDGRHLALFYADFFPRASKRGGAWMTDFRGQSIKNGVEYRPFVSIVCNFTKPTADAPSLITHDEFTTFLHEFGHALHGILAEGRYPSLTGTSVSRDFVELPSQIMENWAFEPDYLNSFAKHYQTGEAIPAELIEKIVAAKNYLAGYAQVRQLHFALLDMSWHTLTEVPQISTVEFETAALAPYNVMPVAEGAAFSGSFSHIFSGGYSAGYYSYKWAEVLEADAFSRFKEEGIFNTDVADSFRKNILSAGGAQDEAEIYRNFRGHDPQPQALMEKLGLTK